MLHTSPSYETRVLMMDVAQLHMEDSAQTPEALEDDPFTAVHRYYVPEAYVEESEEIPTEAELKERIAAFPGIVDNFTLDGAISPAGRLAMKQELSSLWTAPPKSPELPLPREVQPPLFQLDLA